MPQPAAPLQQPFNSAAAAPAPSFCDYLDRHFKDAETTAQVVGAFEKMGLPLPQDAEDFMQGTEGALLFLNTYGVVVRIEQKERGTIWDRIDNSPWVLKPIASIEAGQATIEICPGCRFVADDQTNYELFARLRSEGINFWDDGAQNAGRVPVETKTFPQGIPVVVDRLAVQKMKGGAPAAAKADVGPEVFAEAERLEEKLYAPLRQSFAAGWEDSSRMKDFWQMCRRYVAEKKLVAGWTDDGIYDFEDAKPEVASQKAAHYALRLDKGRVAAAVSSGATAARQSLRPQS